MQQRSILTGSGATIQINGDTEVHEALLNLAADALGGFVAEVEGEQQFMGQD